MDGILVIDKPKNFTSRDVVNIIGRELKTKKVGHTGTLDPLATGVLVVCVGKATKLVELLTCEDKEYIASVKLGILTDTLDTDGAILEKEECSLDKEKLEDVINSFKTTYNQEVPKYSAVKVNGKKLYEYARNNINVNLPKREITIKDIGLLKTGDNSYKFYAKVSKGTYIRSLIKDINDKAGIIGVMSDLRRTKQGKFEINDSCTIEDVKKGNYKLISIDLLLKQYTCIQLDNEFYTKIKNGCIIDNIYDDDMIVFIYNDEVVAIYKIYDKDNTKMKPYKMFI